VHPCLLHVCSDALVRLGSIRHPQRGTWTDGRTKWQLTAHVVIDWQQITDKKRTEQRTLNPRVRGSSPWRRTRIDLGFQ
jgi:hypothetical protein